MESSFKDPSQADWINSVMDAGYGDLPIYSVTDNPMGNNMA